MAEIYSLETHQGAAALRGLIEQLGQLSDSTCCHFDADGKPLDDHDHRDYVAMAAIVRQNLKDNVDHQAPAHRNGYMRALVDLLCMVADGCVPDIDDWDPLRNTAGAFEVPGEVADLLRRVRRRPQ